MTAKKEISVQEFDKIFDEGKEDIMDYLDLDNPIIHDPKAEELKRVNVDFPNWMVDDLDREARRLGVNRQAVIKMIVDEGLARRKEVRKYSA